MPSLTDIEGIGPSTAAACVKNNYRSIAKIATAKPVELSIVPGISEKGAKLIIASAKSLLAKPLTVTSKARDQRKAVAPPKVAIRSVPARTKAGEGKPSARKTKKTVKNKEEKMSKSGDKNKEKIKELKKKIKKLKKEKKKIIAKDCKKQKKEKAKKSNKKK